jgi:type IV secretion system protein VirB8
MTSETKAAAPELAFEDAQTLWRECYGTIEERCHRRGIYLWVAAGIIALSSASNLVQALHRPDPPPPIVLREDPETHFLTLAPTLDLGDVDRQEAHAHAELVQYVIARESYDPQSLQQSYDKVYARSSAEVWAPYATAYDKHAVGNLLAEYQTSTQVQVQVKSISFPKSEPGVAFVRFATLLRRVGEPERKAHWVSTVRFHFGDAPQTPEGRVANPSAFEVIEYRREPEVVNAPVE